MKEKFRRKLVILETQNPTFCFCESKELNPTRDFENDPVVFYTDDCVHPIYGNMGKQPYRKCQLCGKAYYAGMVMA